MRGEHEQAGRRARRAGTTVRTTSPSSCSRPAHPRHPEAGGGRRGPVRYRGPHHLARARERGGPRASRALKRRCNDGASKIVAITTIVARRARSEDTQMRAVDDPMVGTVLAGYRIEAVLGRGGMSVVYLAEDLRLKRKVALKLLAAELGGGRVGPEPVPARVRAGGLDRPSPHRADLRGRRADGRLFIAMRYVEGGDLSGASRDGPLEPAVAARHRRAGRKRARRRPRARTRPPRRQALEHAARPGAGQMAPTTRTSPTSG